MRPHFPFGRPSLSRAAKPAAGRTRSAGCRRTLEPAQGENYRRPRQLRRRGGPDGAGIPLPCRLCRNRRGRPKTLLEPRPPLRPLPVQPLQGRRLFFGPHPHFHRRNQRGRSLLPEPRLHQPTQGRKPSHLRTLRERHPRPRGPFQHPPPGNRLGTGCY